MSQNFHRGRRILLLAIGVIALLVWSTWCGSIVSLNSAAASTAAATATTSKTVVSMARTAPGWAHGFLTPP
jgi:hypothetical protein